MPPPITYALSNSGPVVPFTPELPRTTFYQYVFGGNGVFLRAECPLFEAVVPWSPCVIRDLPPVETVIRPRRPRVPADIVADILRVSRGARDEEGRQIESLFHLVWDEPAAQWVLEIPDQEAYPTSVRPKYSGAGSSHLRASIEVHSHHDLKFGPRFSETDDKDETLLRVYAVVGHVSTHPGLRTRLGIYQQFFEISSEIFFELPAGVADCVAVEQRQARARARLAAALRREEEE